MLVADRGQTLQEVGHDEDVQVGEEHEDCLKSAADVKFKKGRVFDFRERFDSQHEEDEQRVSVLELLLCKFLNFLIVDFFWAEERKKNEIHGQLRLFLMLPEDRRQKLSLLLKLVFDSKHNLKKLFSKSILCRIQLVCDHFPIWTIKY